MAPKHPCPTARASLRASLAYKDPLAQGLPGLGPPWLRASLA